MTNLFPMFYETLFGITALFIFTKVLGKTQISQLTAFDFIAAIVLGELVGNALFDEKAGIKEIGFVILIWGIILYIIEMITQKFKGSRHFLEGKPALIVHEGEIMYEEMRRNKIDINEVQQLLRKKDVFAIQDVQYAVYETNGEMSVLKKAHLETPTREDMKIIRPTAEMAVSLINDGEMIYDNLAEIDKTETWLKNELRKQDFDDVKEIFYAEYLTNKPLFIQPYHKIKHKDYVKKQKK